MRNPVVPTLHIPQLTYNQHLGNFMNPRPPHPPLITHQHIHYNPMINHHNIPSGNPGLNGPIGINPMTLPTPRDSGKTTKSPTIGPTQPVNGLTTRKHQILKPLTSTTPPDQSLPFPLTVSTLTNTPNASPTGLAQSIRENPRSFQGMFFGFSWRPS